MDDKEDILLDECKLHIIKTGRAMNIFSYVATAGIIGLIVGGIVMLSYGSRIDSDMPYYLEMLISFGGIASILVSALLVPPVVFMRRAVHAAKQMDIGNDVFPAAEFERQTHLLWKYLTVFITAAFILAFFATAVICFYILSIRNVF